jgi:hypothetical protein
MVTDADAADANAATDADADAATDADADAATDADADADAATFGAWQEPVHAPSEGSPHERTSALDAKRKAAREITHRSRRRGSATWAHEREPEQLESGPGSRSGW